MKRKVNTICSITFIILFITLLCFPVCAVEYGTQYPAYVPQSSSCFVECNTNLGLGSFVFPYDYVENTIGFYNSNHLCNMKSSSITGYFILQNGTVYEVRGSSLNAIQYTTQNSYSYTYQDIYINSISNTNCKFMTESVDNSNTIYHLTDFQKIIICISLIILFAIMIFGILIFMRLHI